MRGSVGTLRLISLETVSALGAVCAVTLSGSWSSHRLCCAATSLSRPATSKPTRQRAADHCSLRRRLRSRTRLHSARYWACGLPAPPQTDERERLCLATGLSPDATL